MDCMWDLGKYQSRDVSQISFNMNRTLVNIKNESKTNKTWFRFRFKLTDKKIFYELRRIVTHKRKLLLYIVFCELKKAVENADKNSRHSEKIEAMYKEICNIYDKLTQENEFNIQKICCYKKEMPDVSVVFADNQFQIYCEMFSDYLYVWDESRPTNQTPIEAAVDKIRRVEKGITYNFKIFYTMVRCIIYREIQSQLEEMDKTHVKDADLLEFKNKLDEVISRPKLELKRWINNNQDIPGMYKLVNWKLKYEGQIIQVYYTKLLKDNGVFTIVGVENEPKNYGENPTTNESYDVDIEAGYEKLIIPIQMYVREGDLSRQIRTAAKCIGEKIVGVPGVIDKHGATNDNYGKAEDYCSIVNKLAKTPPGGVLLIISNPLPHNHGIIPLKEWWCNGILDEKCILIMQGDRSTICSKSGFDTKIIEKMSQSLGSIETKLQTDSDFTLCGDFTNEQILQLANIDDAY